MILGFAPCGPPLPERSASEAPLAADAGPEDRARGQLLTLESLDEEEPERLIPNSHRTRQSDCSKFREANGQRPQTECLAKADLTLDYQADIAVSHD